MRAVVISCAADLTEITSEPFLSQEVDLSERTWTLALCKNDHKKTKMVFIKWTLCKWPAFIQLDRFTLQVSNRPFTQMLVVVTTLQGATC